MTIYALLETKEDTMTSGHLMSTIPFPSVVLTAKYVDSIAGHL